MHHVPLMSGLASSDDTLSLNHLFMDQTSDSLMRKITSTAMP